MKTENWLEIEPLMNLEGTNCSLYLEATRSLLMKVLPESLTLQELPKMLPLITWTKFKELPFNLSFIVLWPFRPKAFQFFHELITRWLVPGRRLNIELFFAIDFRFKELGDTVYTLAEVRVRVETEQERDVLKQHLPIVSTELRLGIVSVYHARRILEIKGIGADEKTAMVQESIAALIKRQRQGVDFDIFSEMQHFLVTCGDRFKAVHEYRYISRLICFFYLFRRTVRSLMSRDKEKRHLVLKLMKVHLRKSNLSKPVLGVLVCLNMTNDHEIFEERHLLSAVKHLVPQAKMVDASCIQNTKDGIKTLYMEVEQENEFSLEELNLLKKELASIVKNQIERLVHPIFMPRNEEEIMRHILTLSGELKYVRDIPEVILTFDEHTATRLSFTVILLRVLKPGSVSIQEIFRRAETFLEYIPDRTKIVGMLRGKHAKEASVFHVRLDKACFLRQDHSVDLYKARQTIVAELIRILGDLRDFNGGMISKQNELFVALKELLGSIAKHHELILENFFYSLTPVVMRTLLEPLLLKNFFIFLLDSVEDGIPDGSSFSLKVHKEQEGLFIAILAKEIPFKETLIRTLENLKNIGYESVISSLFTQEIHCLGLIYRGTEEEKQSLFYSTIEEVIQINNEACSSKLS